MLKTIEGLCKDLITRLDLVKAEEGFNFVLLTYQKAYNSDNQDLFPVIKTKHNLANMHLMKLDYLNHKTYDAQDRPAKLALEARESVERILGAED